MNGIKTFQMFHFDNLLRYETNFICNKCKNDKMQTKKDKLISPRKL